MNRYAKLAIEVEGHSASNRFEIARIGDDIWLEDKRLNPNGFPQLTELTFRALHLRNGPAFRRCTVCPVHRFYPCRAGDIALNMIA